MKTVLLAMFLSVLVSAEAAAGPIEWTAVTKTRVGKNSDVTGYAAVETISRTGSFAKMWHLWDYKKPRGNPKEPFMSVANKTEFDCVKRNARVLMVVFYEGSMGSGLEDADEEEDPRGWVPSDRDEMHSTLINLACDKK